MPDALGVLLDALDLEPLEQNLFRGKTPPTRLVRIFGGQVAAQALVAAQRTVPGKHVHSLHAYFLRAGDPSGPVVYEVDRIRDGRSYATRRVVGIQGGRAIFNLQASFKVPEPGYERQLPFPGGGTDPEELPPWRAPWADQEDPEGLPPPSLPFELRSAPPAGGYTRLMWFRTAGTLPEDPTVQQCVAAYASDLTLLTVSLEAYALDRAAAGRPMSPGEEPSFLASLDHAMWFHRPFRVDDWMLYAQRSPSSGDGRGLCEGHMFSRDGRLAISIVQEGALRPPRDGSEQ